MKSGEVTLAVFTYLKLSFEPSRERLGLRTDSSRLGLKVCFPGETYDNGV